MTIFLVLTLSLLIFFACRKHKFILFYAPFSIVLQPWMCIRYSAPALSVSFAINFVLTIFLLLKRKKSIKNNPFYSVIALMFLGNIIGLLSSGDIGSSFPAFVQSTCSFAPLLLLYGEIRTGNDLKIVVKTFIWTAVVLLAYGFTEFITQKNPLLSYIITQVSEDNLFGKVYFYENGPIRFGSIRCQSLMAISIAWGGLCVMFFYVVVSIKDRIKQFFSNKVFYLMALLSLVGLFSTGSRSPYVFFVIVFLPFFVKKISWRGKVFCLISATVMLVVGHSVVDDVINSFSSKSDVSGSSLEMRINQLSLILTAMKDNFIFGLGNKGLSSILKMYPNVYGAESIWFHTFISAGICGVLLLVLQYYLTFRVMMKKFQRTCVTEMGFFLFGWITFATITTSPGLSYVYFLTLLVIIMKSDMMYAQKYRKG